MKLTKVLRILDFNENHWMKSYIQLNTEMREKPKSLKKTFKIYEQLCVLQNNGESPHKGRHKIVKTDGSENLKLRNNHSQALLQQTC